jgi:hypothetical protein
MGRTVRNGLAQPLARSPEELSDERDLPELRYHLPGGPGQSAGGRRAGALQRLQRSVRGAA